MEQTDRDARDLARERYRDTGLEHLPHLHLGTPVEQHGELWEEIEHIGSFHELVSEVEQNEHGYLWVFDDADRESLEPHLPADRKEYAGAVRWVPRNGSLDVPQDTAVHLLTEEDLQRIRTTSTSLLLERLLDVPDERRIGRPDPGSPIENLLRHLRAKRRRQEQPGLRNPDEMGPAETLARMAAEARAATGAEDSTVRERRYEELRERAARQVRRLTVRTGWTDWNNAARQPMRDHIELVEAHLASGTSVTCRKVGERYTLLEVRDSEGRAAEPDGQTLAEAEVWINAALREKGLVGTDGETGPGVPVG